MRLQQDIDFTTLNWVKQELDETLKQARQALEAYVDDPADSSLMRFCATYLHQVQGTLRMVELYGAAMVVEEMERVAQCLLDDTIRNKNDAYEVLMRGIVQLPDYLERLQGGHKDIPIVLLPLLNDLRACRGEKLLSEGVLFSPDLSAPLPPSAAGPDKPLPDIELKPAASRLRTNYQMALVKWLRDQTSNVAAAGLMNALDGLRSITFLEDSRRLWWVRLACSTVCATGWSMRTKRSSCCSDASIVRSSAWRMSANKRSRSSRRAISSKICFITPRMPAVRTVALVN